MLGIITAVTSTVLSSLSSGAMLGVSVYLASKGVQKIK